MLKLPLLLSFPLVRPQPNHLLESRYDVCGSTQCDRVFRVEKYRFSLVPRICIYHHISGRIRPLSLGTKGDDRSLRYFQHLLPVHPFDVGHLWPAVDDQKTPILNLSATGSSWSIVRYSTRNRIRRHRRSPLRRSLVIDTGNQDWHPKSLYSDRGNR